MKRFSIFLAFLLIACGLFAQAMDQTLATVSYTTSSYKKTQPILLSKIRSEIQAAERKLGKSIPMETKKQYVESKVLEVLFMQMCDAEKISVTDQEISQALVQQGQGRMTEKEIYAELAKQGSSADEVKAAVTRQILQTKWVQTKYAAAIKALPVPTEEEIFKKYDLMKSQLTRPDSIRVAMIVMENGTPPDAAKAKSAIEKIYQQVKGNPTKFNEILFKGLDGKSEYKSISDSYIGKKPEAIEALGQVFYDKVFALGVKEISQPIEVKGQINGYVIVFVNDVYKQAQLEMSDTLLPGKGSTIHDSIRDQLYQEKVIKSSSEAFSADIEAARSKSVKYIITPDKLDAVLTW